MIFGHKAQGRRIDTIPQAPIRAIGKHMPQMGIRGQGSHLSASHSMGGIGFFDNVLGIEGSCKTGPPRAGIEFVEGGKQRLPRNYIHIQSLVFMIPIWIVKRRFSAVFPCNIMLKRGESHKGENRPECPKIQAIWMKSGEDDDAPPGGACINLPLAACRSLGYGGA
jgi:hypothetical protein